MLYEPMKTLIALCTLCAWQMAHAQVTLDAPLQLTGSVQQRTIENLGAPISTSSLITVESSVRSEWAWANATLQGTTIILDPSPAMESYRDGALMRFVTPVSMQGPLTISINGLPAVDLVRPDGEPPAQGQLTMGRICEVMFVGGRFHLVNAPEMGCPSGFLQVNDSYCIEISSSTAVDFFVASDACAVRGGALCTWSEYGAACLLLQGQFTSMFVDWEWVDDTSNHSHTAVQVARTTCASQRASLPSLLGRGRCCYHLR